MIDCPNSSSKIVALFSAVCVQPLGLPARDRRPVRHTHNHKAKRTPVFCSVSVARCPSEKLPFGPFYTGCILAACLWVAFICGFWVWLQCYLIDSRLHHITRASFWRCGRLNVIHFGALSVSVRCEWERSMGRLVCIGTDRRSQREEREVRSDKKMHYAIVTH